MKEQHKKIIAVVIVGTIILLILVNFIKPKNISFLNQQNETLTSNQEIKKIDSLTVKINQLNNSEQSGTAQLTTVSGGKTLIDISVNTSTSSSQPIYIHTGSCDKPVEKKNLLSDLKNGSSKTIIEISINELINSQSLIMIHKSVVDFTNFTSCGKIESI